MPDYNLRGIIIMPVFSEWEKKKLRRIEKLENSHITSKAAKMELK